MCPGMIKADKGQYLKRVEFKARGRQGMRRKYRCHLTVRCLDSERLTMHRWMVESPPPQPLADRHCAARCVQVVVQEVEDIFLGVPEERRLVIGKDNGPRTKRQYPDERVVPKWVSQIAPASVAMLRNKKKEP